ncbi:1162_t:CDS:10 [Entrophospora sp. SA101]|nr:1162_t:CDS:10 [Entrophospora sp. SA101]
MTTSSALQTLLNWSKESGVVSDVEVQEIPDKGLGFVTKQATLCDNKVVAFIPFSLTISKTKINRFAKEKAPKLDETIQLLKNSGQTLTERLAIIFYLLYERVGRAASGDPPSIWKEYVDILPRTLHTPLFYNESLKTCLNGTSLKAAVEAKHKKLEREYALFRPYFNNWTLSLQNNNNNNVVVVDSAVTFEHYKWADGIFWSRILSFGSRFEFAPLDQTPYRTELMDDYHLVPYLDFANHSLTPCARWELTTEGVELVLTKLDSDEQLLPETEICISYGDKPNSELLFIHGFTLSDNPCSTISFNLPFYETDELIQAKLLFLQDHGIKPLVTLKRKKGGTELSEYSTKAMWLCVLTEDYGLKVSEPSIDSPTIELIINDKVIENAEMLESVINGMDLLPVIQFRVADLILDNVMNLLSNFKQTNELVLKSMESGKNSRELAYIKIYREDEYKFLEYAVEDFTSKRESLMNDETVQLDLNKWILKRLFQPISLENDKNIQVLHVSNLRLASLMQSQNERKVKDIYTLDNLPDLKESDDKCYRLMPHSCIVTLATKYRMVFLLDVTTSLATIDCNNTREIIISEVMKTVRRCLEGIVQPFMIQDINIDKALQFQPEISITVIAECSHFASNANLIPLLAGFPTMSVLMQGIIVTKNNVLEVIEKLRNELSIFQDAVATFRQGLLQKKFPVAYVMDVTGSSGANLSYSLNAGLFALKLLQNEGMPSLLVITDGVVKSNLAHMSVGDDVIQQLCKEGVRCNIIQVGSNQNFNPGCNFGLIPDNEVLKFVSTATSGVFFYSCECPNISSGVRSLNDNDVEWHSLNFYHRHLLMKETRYMRRKNHHQRYPNNSVSSIDSSIIDVTRQHYGDSIRGSNFNFPWDPKSLPPTADTMSTRYREYSLLVDVQQLIFARIRQGFSIDDVFLFTSKNYNKAERIHISMSRLWLPNVTVQYKIRALWISETKGLLRLKSPRIEINVISDTLLAIYLLNFQTAQQNNDPSHPLFTKFMKLLKFLTTIYETDELLKKYFYHKLPKETSILTTPHLSHVNNRLEILKQLWDFLEQSPQRLNTNFWYEDTKFDFLISLNLSFSSSPIATTIRKISKLNKSSSIDQRNKDSLTANIKKHLTDSWATFTFSDNIFVKVLNAMEDSNKLSPLSFCELRINNEAGNLYSGNLSPLSSFLIKNFDRDMSTNARQLTGKNNILRSYLNHWKGIWLSDIEREVFLVEYRNIPIQDLAYQHLCQARLDEGYLMVFQRKNLSLFYREINFHNKENSNNQNNLCGVQYLIFKDSCNGEIITEIWMEQPTSHNIYESFINCLSGSDRQILSHIVTFDQINYIARSCTQQRANSGDLSPPKPLRLPDLFNLSALLRSSGMLISNYTIPSFKSPHSNIIMNQLPQITRVQSDRPSSISSDDSTSRSSFTESKSSIVSESSNNNLLRRSSTSANTINYGISNRNLPLEFVSSSQRKLSLSLSNDITYFIDRDSITNLNPFDRDLALLHLFVEKTLSKHIDGEIETNYCGTKDSIIKEINNGLLRSDSMKDSLTTLSFIRNLRETRCFIKIVDPSSFLLLLIPSFKFFIDDLVRSRGFYNEDQTCYLGLIIFLCKRPKPLDGINSLNKDLDLLKESPTSCTSPAFKIVNLSNSTTASNSMKNLLEPKFLSCDFPKGPKNLSDDIPDQTARLISNINQLYSHGFVKSIYASVLQKHCITEIDFRKVMDVCLEKPFDIDITGYVNVHVQSSRKGLTSDDDNDVYQKFVAVLGHYFEPVSFDGDGLFNVYYYRPLFKKSNNSTSIETTNNNSSIIGDIAENFLEIFNFAENPFFLRLECTFKKQSPVFDTLVPSTQNNFELKETNHIKFPVRSLPTTYSCTINDKYYDFSPESIGTQSSPVESSDGTTATLHLICMTLPTVEDDMIDISPGFVDIKYDDCEEENRKSETDYLTGKKLEALHKTRDRIDWLLKEEIMHGLLNSQPVDRPVLRFIQDQLKAKNPFVDFPTSFTVPLSFVKRKQGQEHFLKEFRLGISLDNPIVPDDSKNFRKQLFWLLLDTQETSIQMYFYSKAVSAIERSNIIKHVRNCIIQASERVNRLVLLNDLNETRHCSKYLVPPDGSSDSESSSEDGDLSTTGDLVDALSMTPNDGNLNVSMKFKPGQFECPLVYEQKFPLHWRLRPHQALNSVTSLILHQLVVNNRKHMFVIPKEKNIFYIKVSEVDGHPIYENDDDVISKNHVAPSPLIQTATSQSQQQPPTADLQSTISNEEIKSPPSSRSDSPKITSSPNSRKSANISTATNVAATPQSKLTESRELVVKVFGLEPPGKETIDELMLLLENKLTTNITLNVMSTHLARNPYKINLTRADVDFILPLLKSPKRLTLRIPSSIKNPYAFLVFYKQNIQTYLNVLNGQEVINAVRRYHQSRYGIASSHDSYVDNGRKYPLCDIQLQEFTFFYNYNSQSRSPSIFEASVGQGIAGICLTLLDKNSRPVFELPLPSRNDLDDVNINEMYEYYENEDNFVISESDEFYDDNKRIRKGYELSVDMWAQGPMNSDILLDRMTKSFQQCICDFFIEVSITKGLGRVHYSNETIQQRQKEAESVENIPKKPPKFVDSHVQRVFIDPTMELLSKAANLSNPALHSLNLKLEMPAWMIDDFMKEVHELLSEVNPVFIPIILRIFPKLSVRAENFNVAYEIYRPYSSTPDAEMTSSTKCKYLIIAGLKEMNVKYGMAVEDRRNDSSKGLLHSRENSVEDFSSNEKGGGGVNGSHIHSRKNSFINPPIHQRSLLEDIMMYKIPPSSLPGEPNNRQKVDLFRSCFLVMSFDGFEMTIYIYNWEKQYAEQIFGAMKSISDWHNKRIGLLNNILHQKMGLFYHVDSPQPKPTPQTSTLVHNPINTPRAMQPPIPGPQRASSQAESTLNNQKSGYQDLLHIDSMVYQRFPQRHHNNEENKRVGDTKNEESKKKEIEANQSALTNFNVKKVLKDSFIEPIEEFNSIFKSQDALKRHGPSFIDTCIRQAKILQDHENALKVYNKWVKRYQEHNNDKRIDVRDAIAKSDLSIVFRTSRLLHFCRTPLLFNAKKIVNKFLEEYSSYLETIGMQLLHFCRTPLLFNAKKIVNKFLEEYSSYLETIGMHVVIDGKPGLNIIDDGSSSNNNNENPTGTATTATLDHNKEFYEGSPVFLLKALQGGSIMCEVGIQNEFVCVTLYTMNRRYGKLRMAAPGFIAANGDRHSLKVFTEECGRFKKMIHVNSFVYDFHLRYIKHILEEQMDISPPFNVLEIIKQFINRHSCPAYCARNRIYYGIFEKETESIPDDLFTYIIKTPQRYNFRSTCFKGEPIACFATFSNYNFTADNSESVCHLMNENAKTSTDSSFFDHDAKIQYTLIFSSTNKNNPGKISIEYYVIFIDDSDETIEAFTLSSSTNSTINFSSIAMTTVNSTSSIGTTTPPAGDFKIHQHNRQSSYHEIPYKQTEVNSQTNVKLDNIINQAIKFYHRDSLWNQLWNCGGSINTGGGNISGNNGVKPISTSEFLILTKQCISRELIAINPDFKDFLDLELNWNEKSSFRKLSNNNKWLG